jgi:putative FmdB family regulatory protein
MPVYCYECHLCGSWELKQRITDEALKVCPTCGTECQRMIPKTPPTVWWVGKPHLKESGLL